MNDTRHVEETPPAAWFALRTSSRHEKRVHERLLGIEIEAFLPLWERLSRWKDRLQRVQVPLFSGYCFARFAWPERMPVLKTAGVLEIVGASGPEPVDDREIDSLKRLVEGPLKYDPCPYLREGMTVEVVRGPLAGVRGVLLQKDRKSRLVIGVDIIRQGASVEIDVADVVPA
jgi:transcriptional antiterminator NusG